MGSDDTLRAALLSLGPATGMSANRRVVGGASILERQIDVALALGCRRILLATPEQDGLAIRAQRLAEAGGAQFRLVQRGRQLLGSLRQQDELVVLAEGLLPGDKPALELLRSGPVVLTLPGAEGAAGGFERLDRDQCWAGGLVLPGRLLERLEELGDDIDPASALLRAARAARIAQRAVPEEWLATGRWTLAPVRAPRGEEVQSAVAIPLLRAKILRPLAARLVERPRVAIATGAAGGLAGTGAVVALLWSWPAIALIAAAFAGLALGTWDCARELGRVRIFSSPPRGRIEAILPHLPDPIAAAALVAGLHTQFGWPSTLYMAAVSIASWVLASLGSHRSVALFADRTLLWLLCGAGGLAGVWIAGPVVASALSLGGILLNMRNQPAITQA